MNKLMGFLLASLVVSSLALAALVEVRGTIYKGDVEVSGIVTEFTVTLPEPTPGESPTVVGCTPSQEDACWFACEQQIVDPYCAQWGTTCEQSGGGGVSCRCIYFCVRDAGGVQHRPSQLMLRDTEDER